MSSLERTLLSIVRRYLGATDIDWLKGMDDATFLKPIYMATVLSPLVLMSEMPLVMNSRGKIPFYQLVNVRISDHSQTCQCL